MTENKSMCINNFDPNDNMIIKGPCAYLKNSSTESQLQCELCSVDYTPVNENQVCILSDLVRDYCLE